MDASARILELPNESLIQIFEYLSYEEVSKFRIVCKRFDDVCQKILNCGFKRAIHQSMMASKRIKSLLPRRESERRNHPLVRHADILSSVETRLSMLSMTYTRYMDINMCCFIPGRVLDEIFHILRLTMQSYVTLRPHDTLQELRDISSMAMEHFDDHIAVEFKKNIERNAVLKVNTGNTENLLYSSTTTKSATTNDSISSELFLIGKCTRTSILTPLASLKLPERMQSVQPNVSVEVKKGQTSSKPVVIKKLQKSLATLHRKNFKQNQHFKRKIYRLNRNLGIVKRRLHEMDSKYKELIETIKQCNVEQLQHDISNNLNATRSSSTTDPDSVAIINLSNENSIDLIAATVNKSPTREGNITTAIPNIETTPVKRVWMSDDAQPRSDGNKRKRTD